MLCIDGVGEWATTTIWHGQGTGLKPVVELQFPHSLGLLYSAFTYFCGFKVDSGEYKLMGLAPYGEPRYADLIRERLIDIRPDGSFRLNMRYFEFLRGQVMTGRGFEKLFGGPRREPEGELTRARVRPGRVGAAGNRGGRPQARADRARADRRVAAVPGRRRGPELRRQRKDHRQRPSSTRSGSSPRPATPAARWARRSRSRSIGAPRAPTPAPDATGCPARCSGPEYGDDADRRVPDGAAGSRTAGSSRPSWPPRSRRRSPAGKVVGWFQGRMEFGPRALGARSILGDPRDPRTQSVMNLKIKFRESFRPFAPSVLRRGREGLLRPRRRTARTCSWSRRSPRRLGSAVEADSGLTGLDLLKVPRSVIPAVTHVDYSARVQTVRARDNPRYHRLLPRSSRRPAAASW